MPECAELRPVAVRPVAVLPLWRRAEAEGHRNADRSGVLRGHPGPVADGQGGPGGRSGRAGAAPED
ncbi:hypothetical protein ACIRRH_16250 [Kitasatospora sp. NPDC101235]|uniref:hypothetical protein n=1 Tax=Kitasatospora sp. NPDC101235 TaxID=3364101 RepID=UPI003820D96C